MRLSRYFLPTLKELPSDADTVAARFMLRAGMIRKVAAGLYEWLPFGLRVLRKVEKIIREEMDRIGGMEVWLPTLQPAALWEESGRWGAYGREMMRLKDRKDGEFCLAPTAEEVVTDLVRREVRSYRELPLLLYQFGEKFRDEIRPRFGVMRAREFYMKDAYSFHADAASLDVTYKDAYDAYTRIFTRCGLSFRPVEADTGAIGGNSSHEFMVLADTGEETIAHCAACGYAANVERAEVSPPSASSGSDAFLPMSEVDTPGVGAVEAVADLLKLPAARFLKTLVFVADDQPVVVVLRGDTELNEIKLQRLLGAKKMYKAPEDVYRNVTGCAPGFAGPVGLKTSVIADHAVSVVVNAVSGANKTDKHLTNINIGRDWTPARTADLRMIREGDACPRCGKPVGTCKGIEVGHVFKLGTKYSAAMKAGFLTEKGGKEPFIMGCYGIGVSRVVAAAIEQRHDENGIIWPAALAPFQAAVMPLNVSEPAVMAAADKIYSDLLAAGVDVLMDDRDQRAGVKFKDADLMGLPWRVVIGDRKLAEGKVELKPRSGGEAEDVPLEKVVDVLLQKVRLS
jgi:prolyl-tRNA synthetase